MTSTPRIASLARKLGPWFLVAGVVVIVGVAQWRESRTPAPAAAPLELIGSLRAPVASEAGLSSRIAEMETRLASRPDDSAAKIVLAEALVRQARVTGNGAHAARAEQWLQSAVESDPADYDAQRMLGVVLLSLHKFKEAIDAGEKARRMRPDDPWNFGVIGDGLLELGRYDEAFEMFQQMMDRRPNAASYARASYALELQGDLEGALNSMRLAANATSPRDAEGLAWATVHFGDLLFKLGHLEEAGQHYAAANRLFSNHPMALTGLAHVAAARGQDDDALATAETALGRAPSISLAAFIGDLHARNGRGADAERFYAMAETIGREATMPDESLAGFLAERGRRLDDAVALAEQAVKARDDLRTIDALAWAYFRAGRVTEAQAAATRALRTGTRDKRIVYHAAAIAAARGETSSARALVTRAAARDAEFDVLAVTQVARHLGYLVPGASRATAAVAPVGTAREDGAAAAPARGQGAQPAPVARAGGPGL